LELFLIGLGNPGKEYSLTRHNVGFLFLDFLAVKNNLKFKPGKGTFEYTEGKFYKGKIVLIKPLYFMNLSGLIFSEWKNLKTKNFIVIYDDVDLNFGRVKMKLTGSSGGHKGIESIISTLQTESFPRIRIGIGRPPKNFKIPLRDWVLSNFSKEELEFLVKNTFEKIYNCLKYYFEGGFGKMMTFLNREED